MNNTHDNEALKDLINKEIKNTCIDKAMFMVQCTVALTGMSYMSYVAYHCVIALIDKW
jgi:hypothetical protein